MMVIRMGTFVLRMMMVKGLISKFGKTWSHMNVILTEWVKFLLLCELLRSFVYDDDHTHRSGGECDCE